MKGPHIGRMPYPSAPDCPELVCDKPAVPAQRTEVIEDTWLWLIDTLAAEMTELPFPTRTSLVATLVRKAGYAVADCDYDPAARNRNARIELVSALAARMEN